MALNPTNFPNGIRGPIAPASGTQPTIEPLVDYTGGTPDPDGQLAQVYDADANDNFATLAAKIEEMRAALEGAGISV